MGGLKLFMPRHPVQSPRQSALWPKPAWPGKRGGPLLFLRGPCPAARFALRHRQLYPRCRHGRYHHRLLRRHPPAHIPRPERDLAHRLFTLLEHGRRGQACNVGSDEVVSIAVLVHLVRHTLAPDKPLHILGQPGHGVARNPYLLDIRKDQKQLGLLFTVPLVEAIGRTCLAAQSSFEPDGAKRVST